MERSKVNSSLIRSVGYEPNTRILEIEFNNGGVSQYSSVSAEVHRRLMSAPSTVSYFRDHIEESFSVKRIR